MILFCHSRKTSESEVGRLLGDQLDLGEDNWELYAGLEASNRRVREEQGLGDGDSRFGL
jgi:hypothetical protein